MIFEEVTGKNWTTEVKTIDDDRKGIRTEFYDKRATLKNALENDETLQAITWKGGFQEVSAKNNFLFGALLQGFGGDLKNEKTDQGRKAYLVLKQLAAQSFNVDKFSPGDKVKIDGDKLVVQRKNGKTEEIMLGGIEVIYGRESGEEPVVIQNEITIQLV
ncbi:hypothetical protein HZA38_03735 [Candidatus Peregrinibacteria bacterium]|nr:hypothetical protein [Candidatus Peregrinibacteria bacterium]